MTEAREIGYYWVGKLYEDCMEWMIAKYIGNGEWTLSGYDAIYLKDYFVEIDERQIFRPADNRTAPSGVNCTGEVAKSA
jgi:hypothetical protein